MTGNYFERYTRFRFELQQSDLQRVKRGYRDLQRDVERFEQTAELRRTERGTRAIQQQGRAARAAADDFQIAQRQLSRYQQQFDQTSRNVGLAGDVQSNLGALSALTGSSEIAVAGEVVALVEELPRLKDAVSGLPATLSAAASAIGGPGLGLIGATGALLAVYALASQEAERNRQAVAGFLDSQGRAIDLIRTGSQEEIEARQAELEVQRDNARARLELVQQQEQNFVNALSPFLLGAAELSASLGVGDQSLRALRDEINEAQNAANDAQRELDVLNQRIGDSEVQARLAAEAEAELAEARQQNIDRLVGLELQTRLQAEQQSVDAIQGRIEAINRERELIDELTSQYVLSEDAIASYEQRLIDLQIEQTALADSLPVARLREERERNAQATEEAAKAEIAARVERAKAVQAIANEQIKLRQTTATIAQERASAIAAIDTKLAADSAKLARDRADRLGNIDRDYMRESTDRFARFRRDEQRAQEDATLERLRAIEDQQQRLADAEAGNDVIAFIRAQRDAATENRRLAQDQSRDTRRRVEDFNAETTARQAAFEQQRADLIASFEQRRIDLEQQAAAEREQARQEAAAKLEAERQAARERIAVLQQTARTGTDAIRQLGANVIRTLQGAANDAQRALSAISRNQAASAAAVANAQNAINQINRSRVTSNRAPIALGIRPGERSIFTGGGRRDIPIFDQGGVINLDRPRLFMTGNRPGYSEAMIPFRTRDGMRSVGRSVNISGTTVNVGNLPDGITRNDIVSIVNAGLNDMAQAIIDGERRSA